jgi:hypothetical protein
MQTTEQKRQYVKPAMRVYELKQRSMLLSGSIQGQAGVQDYTITRDKNDQNEDVDWEW